MPGFKRIQRGLRALLGLARPDDAWARGWLLEEEYALFRALDPRDREHSVLVAKELLKRYPKAPAAAVRAALLHDVGKTVRPYRVLERILTALFEPYLPTLPPEPPLSGWRGAVQVRLHHERYGLLMIADPEVKMALSTSPWKERIKAIDDEY